MSLSVPVAPIYPLPVLELMGRVCLAQGDALQRLQYLACRLSLGLADSWLHRHLLRRDDTFYAADKAEQEERVAMLIEASGEGLVTILGGFIEEITHAHIQCVQASFQRVGEGMAPQPALPPPQPFTPRVPGRRERLFSARG